MLVDDRKNYFMLGLTVSLLSHVNISFWYLLFLLVFIQILTRTLENRKVFASGDISALQWILYGYGILNITHLIWFLIFFTFVTLIYFGLKRIFEIVSKTKKNINLPFFGVILISFILNNIIFRLY
jgi:hypothetical protein